MADNKKQQPLEDEEEFTTDDKQKGGEATATDEDLTSLEEESTDVPTSERSSTDYEDE